MFVIKRNYQFWTEGEKDLLLLFQSLFEQLKFVCSRELSLENASYPMQQGFWVCIWGMVQPTTWSFPEKQNSFTYVLEGVLKSCKEPLRYLIYNRCLCEFSHNLAKSFKITSKKIFLVKLQAAAWKYAEK